MNKVAFKSSKSVFFGWLHQIRQQAATHGVNELELEWLLQTCAGLDRLQLRLLRPDEPGELSLDCSLEQLDELWQRRLDRRCPVQYLAGRVQWRDFELTVGPGVLIPRPETEELVDLAIAALETTPELAHHPWADIGTGSGAIALGLARLRPDLPIYAVDCSPEALAIACTNVEALGLRSQVTLLEGRWLEPLPPEPLGGLLSNPPYIPGHTVDELAPEVRLHEPRLALDGGEDGLDAYRVLIPAAAERLVSSGFWAVEHMAGQGEAIAELLRRDGRWDDIRLHHDYAGHDRFVSAHRR